MSETSAVDVFDVVVGPLDYEAEAISFILRLSIVLVCFSIIKGCSLIIVNSISILLASSFNLLLTTFFLSLPFILRMTVPFYIFTINLYYLYF